MRRSTLVLVSSLTTALVAAACSSSTENEPPGATTEDGGSGPNGNASVDGSVADGGVDADAARPPAAEWGKGTEVGSVTDDVWTPGRDSEGTVNAVSWESVPRGRWIQVAETPLTSLDAAIKTAIPGYNDPGSGDLAAVINAYSGIALDAIGLRWWAFGGGHGDSANNGLYRFDIVKMKWAIEDLPDDPKNWVGSGYSDPFSNYAPASAFSLANPTSDVYGDEFYDAERPAASTRKPTARHTYNGMVFNPDLNEVAFGVRRMWRFDLTTKKWSRKNPFNTPGATYTGATGYGGAAGWTYWDEVRHQYFFGPTENYNQSRWWSYDLDDQSWNWENIYNDEWWFGQIRRLGRDLVGFPACIKNNDRTWPPRIQRFNLDTKVMTVETELTGLDRTRCYGDFFEGTVFEYLPDRNKYVAAFRYDAAGNGTYPFQTFEIDPVAKTIKLAPEWEIGSFGGWSPLVKNRFFYVEKLHALLYIRAGEDNLRVFRL